MKKVFLICPVRNATEEQVARMNAYILWLEKDDYAKVYYPARDTNQFDETGYRICSDNATAIEESDEVHVFWDKNSTGSLFDLGVAFGLRKKIIVVNDSYIPRIQGKSFTNMMLEYAKVGPRK